MPSPGRSRWLLRYGTSVLTVGTALGLKFLLIPLVKQDAPFLLFFVAVMISALVGGLGPGLLATALATLCNAVFFMQPFNRFALASPDQPPLLALFVFEGICISFICAKLQSARRRADQSAREARELERQILEISDAEQRRIGHDLHDGLGQHLTGIALTARRLEQRLTAEHSSHSEDATALSGLAKTAVEWTHDLSRSLSPPALETRGLAEALRELAANAETLFNIQCALEQDNEVTFNDLAAAVHLYRIAQEAISNAVKHGGAKHIRLRFRAQNNEILLQILDDGTGIAPSTEAQNGMGLRIMQYRATMIGAEIEVTRDAGTVVTCRYRHRSGN